MVLCGSLWFFAVFFVVLCSSWLFLVVLDGIFLCVSWWFLVVLDGFW